MTTTRAFYIVQGSLRVCGHGGSPAAGDRTFPDSDAGFRDFEAYIANGEAIPALVLVDVIEEVFARDTIPKLGSRDRKALLVRRVERKYPRTPYRLAVVGRKATGDGSYSVTHSSISNHELVAPWVNIIGRHKVPLIGIFSVPMMAPQLLKTFYRGDRPVLFVTQHQGDKLRQTFVHNGLVHSARLSQSPATDDPAYPAFVNTEILRSRRYLERSRLLGAGDQLDIYMITDGQLADEIIRLAEVNSPMQFHFVDPVTAKRRLRAPVDTPNDHLEALYLAVALRQRPRHNYAVSGEQRYWHLSRLRRGIIAAATASGAICSVFAGIYLGDAWRLHRASAIISSQVTQLSETFRRENEDFGPIKADSYEMKLAVDTGDYILEQRVPIPWVLQQLGVVLSEFNDVQVADLRWQAESTPQVAPERPRPGEPARPVAIPATTAVSVDITATLEPVDDDLRAAFARIDAFAAAIREKTAFEDAVVAEYPIDASTRASISGELGRDDSLEDAEFRLRLNFPLTSAGAREREEVNEPT